MQKHGCYKREGSGRGRKTWGECLENDMKRLKLKREDAQDPAVWCSRILGDPITRTSAETRLHILDFDHVPHSSKKKNRHNYIQKRYKHSVSVSHV